MTFEELKETLRKQYGVDSDNLDTPYLLGLAEEYGYIEVTPGYYEKPQKYSLSTINNVLNFQKKHMHQLEHIRNQFTLSENQYSLLILELLTTPSIDKQWYIDYAHISKALNTINQPTKKETP